MTARNDERDDCDNNSYQSLDSRLW